MKKLFFLSFISFCLGFIGLVLWACAPPDAKPPSTITPPGGAIEVGVATKCPRFPGDGYPQPSDAQTDPSYGTTGHGPPLSYTDNGDGTLTDNNTKFIWEKKTGSVGALVDCGDPNNLAPGCEDPHDVNNRYTWTYLGWPPDGTMFTVFLEQLNNACDGDATIPCNSDADCGADAPCGFAGYRDWCIPTVKGLQSIVDYGKADPSIDPTFPGLTWGGEHWSSTPSGKYVNAALLVDFADGWVSVGTKGGILAVRAVRPCQ